MKIKQALTEKAEANLISRNRVVVGLIVLGLSAVFREGFKTVLFLQDTRLQRGMSTVIWGAGVGFVLTVIAGFLTMVAHQRLPYQKMLVLTGAMLGLVFLVMVGEQAQEMQLAGWIPATELHVPIPEWVQTWFAVFPTRETILGQVLAASVVLGSFIIAERRAARTAHAAREGAES
ncbi:hypothetical protein U7230_08090 [Carboxydochorda subterranea]|uniref:Iron permease n=1 Tax=Carboxydichorda subterranea TaxID=3109565 RepID=A0ABZ1BUB1_9FIRM|nr:hypothetical protein [Limnochorda sp. L945t]WRP16070.1 hypothetical protein U7230_08090 [Limnochorda sp. L945t]